MTLNIIVHEQNILDGDTSVVRKELEVLTENTALIKKYQNGVCLTFMNFTLFDIVRKLKTEEFRNWFKKLDRELPGLPHFLSDKGNSLLIYLMGNISFNEINGGIIFDSMEANRFFKEKQAQIRNICLSNNINPESDLNRISAILTGKKDSAPEKNEDRDCGCPDETKENKEIEKPKKSPIKDLLDRYGSIAFLTSDRAVKLTITLDELPGRLSFNQNFLVKDNKFPQPFFSSVISTEKGKMEIRSLIIPNMNDVESSMKVKNGIQIQVVHKVEDGSYQKIFESDKIFPVKTTDAIDEELKNLSFTETSREETPGEENLNQEPPREEPVREEPVHEEKNFKSTSDQPYDLLIKLERLQEEKTQLQEKVSKLEKLVEVYEEEIHKKRSIKGFFKKFFG